MYSNVMTATIIFNLVFYILATFSSETYSPTTCASPACNNDPVLCPGYQICEPQPYSIFETVDIVCVIIFTVDLFIRLSLCAIVPTRFSGAVPFDWDDIEKENAEKEGRLPRDEPYFTPSEQLLRYFFSFNTAIDIISIIPTYVTLGPASNVSLSFFRVLRLLRLLRLLRSSGRGKLTVDLIKKTLMNSYEALAILSFYLSLLLVFFGSVMYVIEQGTFIVNEDYPKGAYLRPDGYGGMELSPFLNIPTSMYFILITMTTVGYGDISATTFIGRYVVCFCALLGVIVLALPISVIGSNFTKEYEFHVNRVIKHKQRTKEIAHKNRQIATKKSGSTKDTNLSMHNSDFIEKDNIHSNENDTTNGDKLEPSTYESLDSKITDDDGSKLIELEVITPLSTQRSNARISDMLAMSESSDSHHNAQRKSSLTETISGSINSIIGPRSPTLRKRTMEYEDMNDQIITNEHYDIDTVMSLSMTAIDHLPRDKLISIISCLRKDYSIIQQKKIFYENIFRSIESVKEFL